MSAARAPVLDDGALLALHRQLVSIPSVSGSERAVADFAMDVLARHGATPERLGNCVIARGGRGPQLLLNTHLDTVPAETGAPEPAAEREAPARGCWTRDPWAVAVEGGRVYGLGANDAKASAAAMIAAFLDAVAAGGPCEVALLLVPQEETGGDGTERAWPWLQEQGWRPDGVVVGEPTDLDIAVAQKGLLVLELTARGDGGHSAHAAALGARNALRELARDLVSLESVALGERHPFLGSTTLEPTVARGGDARNRVPATATCVLDLRTVPGTPPAELVARVRRAVGGDVRVLSDRLKPVSCDPDAAIVRAARAARPTAELFGSRTMSDLVFFAGVDAIKCGPGRTERSHQPDEYVLESEITAGAAFYRRLIEEFPRAVGERGEAR